MKHFTHIASGIDVGPLLAQLQDHPELWDAYPLRRTGKGTPHTGMTDIFVRYNNIEPFIAKNDFRGFNDEHVPVWYPAWEKLPALRPIVFGLMAAVEGEMLGGVLITKIETGKGIERHIDSGWHVGYFDKFYVSLKSEPGADFCCEVDGEVETLNPRPGEIWRFDNRKPHWVANASGADRITLIVCIRTELFQ